METRWEVVSAGEERLRDANSFVYLGAGAGEVRAKSNKQRANPKPAGSEMSFSFPSLKTETP